MGNVRLVDEVGIAMQEVIWSKEGTSLMLSAVGKGRPALEAIDHMLAQAVGANYRKQNGATQQAGYLVTKRMRELGFSKGAQVPFVVGTVARSGVLFHKS